MNFVRILPAGFTLMILTALSGSSSLAQTRGLRAVNDTIDLYPDIPLVFDILANDTIPPGDTIKYIGFGTAAGSPTGPRVIINKVHDAAWKWTFTFTLSNRGYDGTVSYFYKLTDPQPFDTSSALIVCRLHDKSYAYLEINNVRARINAYGPHFFYENPEYEVPKGSGKTSMFSNSYWIGGKDGSGLLHFAGERYGQGPTTGPAGTKHDFFAGPVMDSAAYSIYQDTLWNYVWNLKKSDIDYHRAHYWEPGYIPVPDILTWPGNGNTALGQAAQLAPYSDRNGNGIYEPLDGDYPEIRGDQALFFIVNDDRGPHTESLGAKMKIELHGMAYAYDLPGDSAMKNTVFLNYKIFNRSQNTYDSTLIGIFSDIDLGYANDDYIGCDVYRNMYFGYNGTPVDGTGQPYAYGANPPVQSVTLLAGPYLDPDGIDNPRTGPGGAPLCDVSVNGMNFGDYIADNERMGLQKFIYCNNSNAGVPSYMTDPVYASEYYQLMSGFWKDGSHLFYGGNGHPSAGGYGPDCMFMFPGTSDTLNWGTGCTPPNGPQLWTETTALNNPGDRRGVGVTGPFTFHPGDVQEFDVEFSWARDYAGTTQSSIEKLKQQTDAIRQYFTSNQLPGGQPFYGMNDPVTGGNALFKLFPNPASGEVSITFGNSVTDAKVELLSRLGAPMAETVYSAGRQGLRLSLAGIAPGVYLVRVMTRDACETRKLVVLH